MEFSRQESVGDHFLLQEIFPPQGLNPGLLHCRQILYCLSCQESPRETLAHVYWRKNRKSTSVERWAKPREALAPEWCSTGVFKTGLLNIHLAGHGLTVLINSCNLNNNRLLCTCLSHNSVCCNQMSVCIEYLWTLSGVLLPKIIWGHNYASKVHGPELENLGWSLETILNLFQRVHPSLLMPNFQPNTTILQYKIKINK